MKKLWIRLSIFLSVVFLSSSVLSVYAVVPNEPHSANAIWIEPSTITLTDYAVGDKFNITAFLNVTTLEEGASGIGGWQVMLYYNTTYLNATRTGLTAGETSELFTGKLTFPAMIIQRDIGRVGCMETLLYPSTDYVPPPVCASLCWIEFEVISLEPQPIQFILNITAKQVEIEEIWLTRFVDNRYSGVSYNYPPLGNTQLHNSVVVPEFSPVLSMAFLMFLTIAVAILRKKIIQNSKLRT